METLYFWLALIIIFIIIEMVTAMFYGLSLALASTIVAIMVFVLKEESFTMLQGIVFVISSFFFAIVLPKYMKSSLPDTSQGVDTYTGQVRTVKKVSTDLKISLDGVDYLIDGEDDIKAGDKVKIVGHHGVSMKVQKV